MSTVLVRVVQLGGELMVKVADVINLETGEILAEFNEGDRIVRKASIDSYNELESNVEDITDNGKSNEFIKLYTSVAIELANLKLSGSENAIFLYLACGVRFYSNISKHPNGRVITIDDIREFMDSDRTVRRALTSLKDKGLIAEVHNQDGVCYMVNPFVYSKGNKIEKTTIDVFKNTKWYQMFKSGELN